MRKSHLFLLLFSFSAISLFAQNYELVWSDEFNESEINPDNWTHEIGGQGWGNEALFTPKLTVIGDSYIIRQVANFQNGVRGVHQDAKYGKQMAMMAKVVSEQELNDIVAFLNDQSLE